MGSRQLLATLLRYKAWADEEMIACVSALPGRHAEAELAGVRAILAHALIVDEIFIAHLRQEPQAHASVDPVELPTWDAWAGRLRSADRWCMAYVGEVADAELAGPLAFTFTDGQRGTMTREEMLAHIVCHGGYHRGEAGRLLTMLTGTSPRDTLTGHLHAVEPRRRGEAGRPARHAGPK